MQRLCLILILVFLPIGCAPSAAFQSKENKGPVSSNGPAGLRENSDPVDPAKSDIATKDPAANCPLTVPQDPPFTPPSPYSELGFEGEFWYGSDSLWTRIPQNGIWLGLPHNPDGYTQKIFWWSDVFSLKDELQPALVVFGERLDEEDPAFKASKATNASAGDIGDAMLVGVDFSTLGCWQITGQYKKSELSFVVWVAP